MNGFAPSRAQKEIDAFWRSRMKVATTSVTTYKYDAREILNLIAKDLNVPLKALSFTINADGSYNISCDNEKVPKAEDSYDPYDQYRDADGRLPPSMW